MTHLRTARQSAGLTQFQLAALAGVDTRTVWRIESGRPAMRTTVRKLAKVLGVEVVTRRRYRAGVA